MSDSPFANDSEEVVVDHDTYNFENVEPDNMDDIEAEIAAAEKWQKAEEEKERKRKEDLLRRFREAKGKGKIGNNNSTSDSNNTSWNNKGNQGWGDSTNSGKGSSNNKGNDSYDDWWQSAGDKGSSGSNYSPLDSPKDGPQNFSRNSTHSTTDSTGNFGGDNNNTNTEQDEEKSERLFVTKIPREAVESDLIDYFSQYGNVTDCHMPRVPGRDGHKGIAFLSFDCCDVASTVREMGGHFLFDQELVVDRATSRNKDEIAKKKKGFGGKGDKGGNNSNWNNNSGNSFSKGGWSGNWSSNNNDKGSSSKNNDWGKGKPSRPPPPPLGGGSGFVPPPIEKDNRVFVTKVGMMVTKENLQEYFSQFGALSDIYMPMSQSHDMPHKGIAFLSFEESGIAQEVLSRAQYEIKPGQFVVVDTATNRNNGGGDKGGGKGKGKSGKGGFRSNPW